MLKGFGFEESAVNGDPLSVHKLKIYPLCCVRVKERGWRVGGYVETPHDSLLKEHYIIGFC